MKTKSIRKLNILLLSLLIAVTAIFTGLILSGGTELNTALAAGNSAAPPDGNFDLLLKLDVNGADASTAVEDNADKVSEANSSAYKTREITINALLGIYANNANNEVASADVSKYNTGNYKFSEIFNSFGQYITVNTKTMAGTTNALSFSAQKYKISPRAFIGVALTKMSFNYPSLPNEIKIYIEFEIDSSFVASQNSAYIQNVSTDDKSFYLQGDFDGTAERVTLTNKTSTMFDLDTLAGKQLCYKDTSGKFVDLKESVNTSKDWVLNDISCFTVSSGSVGEIIESDDITISGVTGEAAPVITINTEFNENDVKNFKKQTDPDTKEELDFWNARHYLKFTVKNLSGSQTVTVSKRVYFTSAGAPVLRSPYLMPVSLNATSAFQFTSSGNYISKDDKSWNEQPSTGEDITASGFSQVRVKPSYLCDFPSKGTQYFNPSLSPADINMTSSGIVNLDVVMKKGADGSDTNEVDYYLISALNVGNTVVEFPIRYTTSDSIDAEIKSMKVPVGFDVYGKYSITGLAMQGKKVRSFSTDTDKYFKPFIDNKFYLNSAVIADAPSKEKIQLEYNNNVLKLTPLSSGEAVLKLGFMDLQGKQIYVDWAVSINIEGGSFLNTWPTAYVVLFFIGIGIIALGIILFIVWLFIRGLSKRREEENATSAPTSAYIIKLNSTIAAAQAQQRLATTQAFNAAQTQMLALGAGPTTTGAPSPNTLQLGAAPASVPGNGGTMSMPSDINININVSQPSATEEIYIPLSDDELLERIFVEKYEPRGMARRSFFKSKDLQSRELEKEKARIRDDVRGGMTIEEACKSLSERQQPSDNVTDTDTVKEETVAENSIITILGFDPDSPLVEYKEEAAIAVGGADELSEEVALRSAESRLSRLDKELAALEERLNKAQSEVEKAQKAIESTESTIQLKEESNVSLKKTIEDLEFKLATAKSKDKDKLLKDIDNKEHVIASNKDIIIKLQDELTQKRGTLDALTAVMSTYGASKQTTQEDYEKAKAECEKAKEDYRRAQELMEKARKAQETKGKLQRLRPMLETVNALDVEIRNLVNQTEKDGKEKETFKADVSDLQKRMLGTNDVSSVNELSSKIGELNKQVSALDKAIAAANKAKADKTILFNGERRKANEFIDREEIEVEEVVKEEDDVISKMAFEEYMAKTQADRKEAEENLSALQAKYDELVSSYDTKVMDIAVKTAAEIKEAESALEETRVLLDDLNTRMETASDDDKLMLSIDQMSLNEKQEQQQQLLNEVQAGATKEKMEYQMRYEKELEDTKTELEDAQKAYEDASAKVDESLNKINPLDLILSGSGVISQDRQRLEAENLKKQLELSKSAMEQAKLQAQMAQMEAEKAIIDAQRASDASKQEAEKLAQEAIAKAEQAKAEAEQKVVEEAEKARIEIEKAKAEAEEEKRRMSEEAEKAKREAEEQAEQARLEAEQKAAEAEQKAAEEAEKAKKAAEDEAERAKKAAEDEAERIRREAEEEKQRAAEEAERIKREAEEKAEKERIAKQEEENRIKAKISQKKTQILELRKELKSVQDEQTAKELKEKFYNELVNLDDEEKNSMELKELINKSMDDAEHAGELAVYRDLAHKEPKRVVKKVTERINKIPKKSGKAGTRAGARPTRSGAARPAGARPTSRTGARPASRAGARPTGERPARSGAARPAGARPVSRTGASKTTGTKTPRSSAQKPRQ